MTEPRVVTADDLCAAVESTLKAHLFPLVKALELDKSLGLKEIKEWQQLPDLAAIATAAVPAIGITSPGLTDRPTRRAYGYDATWRVAVGVYERGGSHHETAKRVRTWAALVRTVLTTHTSLGGVATSLRWVGEDYAEHRQRDKARTLGGCAVSLDVGASNVVDLGAINPTVQSTQTDLAVP